MLSDLGEPHFHQPPFPGMSINLSLSSLCKLVIGILFLRELLERMLLSERNAPGTVRPLGGSCWGQEEPSH